MKKLIINNIIIISVILLLVTVTAIIYVANFSSAAREQYGSVSVAKLNAVKLHVDSVINKGTEDVKNLNLNNYRSVPNDYYATAYINNALDNQIILYKNGLRTEYTLMKGGFEKLISNDYNIFYTDLIFTDYEEKRALICFVNPLEQNGNILLFKYAEKVFSQELVYDFDNIMLISADGIVLTDFYDINRGLAIFRESFANELLGSGYGIISTVFNGNPKLFSYTSYDENGIFKASAYIDNAKAEAYIRNWTVNLIIIIIAIMIAAGILAALLLFIYIRHFNSLVFLKKRKTLYVIHVNNMGVMKKANEAYNKEFETLKIYDNILDSCTPSFKILHDCLPIVVKLKNRSGEEKYLIFLTLKTFRGYKLIGENATPIMNLYLDNLKEIRQNENLSMFNMRQFYDDYRNAKKALRINNGLYVLFEVKNITKYRSMFGEEFYNEILKKIANILKEAAKNYGNIYYFNYESFVMLITDSEKSDLFKERLEDFMVKINLPLQIEKSLIKADCVAGVVDIVGELKNYTIKELNSLADYSLQKAYELKNNYEIYNPNKGNYYISYSKKRDMAKSIIENNMLELYFQPQYNIIKNKIVGFEALTRLNGRYEKDIKINEFIEIVERSGYMLSLGDYVLNKAFEFAKSIEDTTITISVNISPIQLLEAGFIKGLLGKFEHYNVKKESIVVEITETFLMTSFNEIIAKLDILKNNGVKIHLDDFGVAYSSMLYLKKLPIATIKIDKAFVSDIIDNEYSRIICSKIIELGQGLKLSLIAEGVETNEQLECLKTLGCKIIQGYYISKAVPAEGAIKLLEKYNGREIKNVKDVS